MNKLTVLLLILIVIIVGWWGYKQFQIKDGWGKIKVGRVWVKVIIRDTVEGRKLGLSGFKELKKNEGMLFVFPVAAKYSFWMKEMKFDLDFVWIKDDRVVDITEKVKAKGGEATKVKPKVSVNKVLEVNSGWVEKNGIKVGDTIDWAR